MKVLMLSIDESILREGSDAGKRMALYGRAAEELHIIVYTKEKKDAFQIAENVYAYPATARFKVLYFLGFYTIAARLLGAGGDWLITSQDAFTHIIGIFLKKKFSVPLEIQIHTDFLSPYFRFESVKNYIRFHLYAYAAKRADSIRVVSERIRKLIEAVKGVQVPVFVLPALIDTEEIKKISVTADLHKKYPQFDFIVLMASRLTKEKDIGLALRAFSVLAKKYRKLGLLIVGDGPEQSALLARTLRLRLDSNVIFERAVPFSDLISYYKTADLFLLTSLYEGYGRTLVEAALAGVPLVTTDVGAARELVMGGITGTIIPVHDAGALQKALEDAIQDYGRHTDYSEKAAVIMERAVLSQADYIKKLRENWERTLLSFKN